MSPVQLHSSDEELEFVDVGTAALVGGTVTISHPRIQNSTMVLLGVMAQGGTTGALRVSSRVPGTSFSVTSLSGTDTSTIFYVLLERGVQA